MITLEMIRNRWNRDTVYRKPEFWDDEAEKRYGQAGTNLWVNPHLNEILHEIESKIVHGWIDDASGKDLLDLGCGAGRFSREFAKRGARVTGVDFSSKSIDAARRLTKDTSVKYAVGSIFDLVQENAYDIIVCSKVLSIACKDKRDLQDALARIRRALRPDGRLLSIEMCHTTFVRRVLSITFAEYHQELRTAGFEVLDAKGAEFIPARLALAFFKFPRWITRAAIASGEVLVKTFPVTSDQHFTYVKRI